MDFSDIKNGLTQFVERYDSQTYLGSYRETSRSSLLNEGLSTRANSLWKMAEYVVAKFDNSNAPLESYISGWIQLASNANNQYLLLEEENSVWGMYDARGNRLGGDNFIIDFFSKMKKETETKASPSFINKEHFPLQRIFFGAPGTGKSHAIKDFTQGECVIRTTFHPDSDYSTFVGAYKPTTKKVPMRDVTGKVIKENGKDVTEDHVVYEFVKQSFLKAYVEAWKRYTGIDNVVFTPKKAYSDIITTNPVTLSENELVLKMKELMNDGWGYPCQRFGVKYWKSLKILNRSNRKHLLSLCELSDSMDTELTKGISVGEWLETMMISDHKEIIDNLPIEDKKDNSHASTNTSVFLVIEEINRGNCAQIFGDLFQLLDRGDHGFSEYPIDADSDIQREIAESLKDNEYFKLDNSIGIDEAVIGYTSNYGKTLSEDIQDGRVLLLPPNLYIWATMNTSDQSLFPIDSAFKRRWDWKYVPISDGKKGWKIKADGKYYDWWQFLQKINDQIGSTTNSEDKKLGYYFCKAKNGIIDAETFVGKVMFYVWNDVYKDFAEEAGDLFKDIDGSLLSFSKFYAVGADGKTRVVEDKVTLFLQNLGVTIEEETTDTEEEEPSNESLGDGKHKYLQSVLFPDGTRFSSAQMTRFEVYLESLKKIGLETVFPLIANMKYKRKNCPLMSLEEHPEILNSREYTYHQEGKFYIVKGANDDTLINVLTELNTQLDLRVEIAYK